MFKESIRDDQINSIKTAMRLRGSNAKDVAGLNTEYKFIAHLVFHECAHVLDSSFSELECDQWAFNKLV